MKIVFLHLTSFQGISIGAIHFYAKLVCNEPEHTVVEIAKKLTRRDVVELNKRRDGYTYHIGDTYHGFFSKDDAIEAGIKRWQKEFPDADALILGNPALAEPQRVLEGPDDFKSKINAWLDRLQNLREHKPEGWDRECRILLDEFWRYYTTLT